MHARTVTNTALCRAVRHCRLLLRTREPASNVFSRRESSLSKSRIKFSFSGFMGQLSLDQRTQFLARAFEPAGNSLRRGAQLFGNFLLAQAIKIKNLDDLLFLGLQPIQCAG